MRVLINCSTLNSTGTLQVAFSFINECKSILQNEYHIIVGPGLEKIIDTDLFPSNFIFHFTRKVMTAGIKNLRTVRKLLNEIEISVKPDVVFTVFGPAYWKPKTRHVQGFATPHVLYPDSPLFKIIPFKRKLWWSFHRLIQLKLLKYETKEIIFETDAMADRLKAHIPSIITHVVPNTCSKVYSEFKSFSDRTIAGDGYFKLLTLCSYKRHKNLEILPFVMKELLAKGAGNVKFYLTLPTEKYNSLIPEQYRNQILNLGPLHPDDCPDAYAKVDAMLLPTLLESFSASYPEAMVMGKPILTSDYDFATTICGNSAIYFDPLSAISIADSIIPLLSDPTFYSTLVDAGKLRLSIFGGPDIRALSYLKILSQNA